MEGAFVLLLSVLLYKQIHASWLLFFVLILAPDLFMLGYLLNVRVGAALYNLVHTYVGPLVLGAVSTFVKYPLLLPLSLIWAAHLGMDRMLGFGLNTPPTSETHIYATSESQTGQSNATCNRPAAPRVYLSTTSGVGRLIHSTASPRVRSHSCNLLFPRRSS